MFMNWTFVLGHNIYIDSTLVGYVGSNHLGDGIIYINGKKFADLTSDGEIYFKEKQVGYINDEGELILNGRVVGEIDASSDLHFFGNRLKG